MSDGKPIKGPGRIHLSMRVVMEITKVTGLIVIRGMLIVIQFSNGVTTMFHVSILVNLESVVVISKVFTGVESSQMEVHFQRSVSPLMHFDASVDPMVESAWHVRIWFHLTLSIVHCVCVVGIIIISKVKINVHIGFISSAGRHKAG